MSVFIPFIHRVPKKEKPSQLPLYIEEYSYEIKEPKPEIGEKNEERGIYIVEL